jgi:hypothetical protein
MVQDIRARYQLRRRFQSHHPQPIHPHLYTTTPMLTSFCCWGVNRPWWHNVWSAQWRIRVHLLEHIQVYSRGFWELGSLFFAGLCIMYRCIYFLSLFYRWYMTRWDSHFNIILQYLLFLLFLIFTAIYVNIIICEFQFLQLKRSDHYCSKCSQKVGTVAPLSDCGVKTIT